MTLRDGLRKKVMGWVIFTTLLVLIVGCSTKSRETPPLPENTKSMILQAIAEVIQGDHCLSPVLQKNIDERLIQPLEKTDNVTISGADADARPIVVNFQKALEQSLVELIQKGAISHLTAIIHTPMPTTPLCNPEGKSGADSMHSSLRNDPARVKTIEDRTRTLRQMAAQGNAVQLYIVYPEGGLQKRSAEEQKTYKEEIGNKKNTSLIDLPLACKDIPKHLIGATYIITTPQNQVFTLLSLSGVQAAQGYGSTDWRIVLGDEGNRQVTDRLQDLTQYFHQGGYQMKKAGGTLRITPTNKAVGEH